MLKNSATTAKNRCCSLFGGRRHLGAFARRCLPSVSRVSVVSRVSGVSGASFVSQRFRNVRPRQRNETPARLKIQELSQCPAILRICTKSRPDTRYRAAEVYENRANGGNSREFFSGTAVAHHSGDHTRVQAYLEDLMRKRLGIMAALAVGSALFVGAADVSAQGRGNGKGRGGDKGGGKPGWAGQQQQRSDRESRRQQEWSDRQSREQQRRSDAESRRQQEWSDRKSREQQRRSDAESRRQQEWSDRDDRGRGEERRRSARKENGTPYWANRNYERPAENRVRQEIRRERKDYEKAERRYEKDYRKAVKERSRDYRRVVRDRDRYDRDYRDYRGIFRDRDYDNRSDRRGRPAWAPGPPPWAPGPPPWAGPKAKRDRYYDQRRVIDDRYYDDYYYGDDDYYDDRYYGGSWRDELLRVVLGNFLGGQGFDGGMPFYAEPRYAQPIYASPIYAGNYYQPAYYDDAGYYGGNDLGGSQYAPLIVGLVDQFSGGYVSNLLARTLATGYYEGLQDGMYARQRGVHDDYYREPYSYAGDNYSMCSVSLGERRRLMAEGYELGYRDAMLQQQADYGYQETPAYFDLVSLALGNVL